MRSLSLVSIWVASATAVAYSNSNTKLVNTTLHSTHPQVRYFPEKSCVDWEDGKCIGEGHPFTMSTYLDGHSKKRTFFPTNSRGNERWNPDKARSVEIDFYGREAYVYGPPKSQLDYLPGELRISVDGLLAATVDLDNNYAAESSDSTEPRLIYHWQGGGADESHVLRLTLWVDADGTWMWFPVRSFAFDSLVVTSLKRRDQVTERKLARRGLESVVLYDTGYQINYFPQGLWKKTLSSTPSVEGFQTFHQVSTEFPPGREGSPPAVQFVSQCSALAVYGAPAASFQDAESQGSYRHGHIQFCLGEDCASIDTHQAYLNVPAKLSSEPVLLHLTDQMVPNVPIIASIRATNWKAQASPPWIMSFSHAVCWKSPRRLSLTHPLENGIYERLVKEHSELQLLPKSSRVWKTKETHSIAMVKYNKHAVLPSWSTTVRAYEIKIYIPAIPPSSDKRHADVLCCVDQECIYPDIEQWYRRNLDKGSDSPLVHFKDLDPFEEHKVSMVVLPRNGDTRDAILAVSRVVCEQVTIEASPAPAPSPSTAIEEPNLPSETSTLETEAHTETTAQQVDIKAHKNSMIFTLILGSTFAVVFLCLNMLDASTGPPTNQAQESSPGLGSRLKSNSKTQAMFTPAGPLSKVAPDVALADPAQVPLPDSQSIHQGELKFELPSPPFIDPASQLVDDPDLTGAKGPTSLSANSARVALTVDPSPTTSDFTPGSIPSTSSPSTTSNSLPVTASPPSNSPQASPMQFVFTGSIQQRRPLPIDPFLRDDEVGNDTDDDESLQQDVSMSPPYIFVPLPPGSSASVTPETSHSSKVSDC